MAVRRRYLRLEERCAGSEVPLMMCRVVEDPLLPLQSYRPQDATSNSKESRSTRDIIPDILPNPRKSVHRRMTANIDKGQSIGTGLWALFEADLSKTNAFYEEIEAVEVWTYSLNNPASFFEELMEDPDYARGVTELVSASKQGLVYLVTGFMTGRGVLSRQSDSKQTGAYVKLTVPTSTAFVPGIGFGDPKFSASQDKSLGNTTEGLSEDEEIFAISYATIKQPKKLAGLGGTDTSAKPRYLAPRFAKRSEAAFASGEESEDEDLIAGLIFEDLVEVDDQDDETKHKELVWLTDP